MILQKYSMGIGDRFAHQGKAQLQAIITARSEGVDIAPVWNKSHREHTIVHTTPSDVRREADRAVQDLGWTGPYYVDADHVALKNVDPFLDSSDFFTLDVADFTGKSAGEDDIKAFVDKHKKYVGSLEISNVPEAFEITPELIEQIARKYLLAVKEAGVIYRHVVQARGAENFITEVSMDETDDPQTPVEMFFILAAVADEGIPAQTIAPKFTGRFNKGVDYAGDLERFEKEFAEDLAVIAFAIEQFHLPENLKLSVHSGSDKFSIYEPIRKAIRKFDAGVHIKTAGTTWLEELIGLAIAGRDGLDIAREVYSTALGRFDELCGPYATVIDIDRTYLPSPDVVNGWSGEQYAAALRHDPECEAYNPNLRQLLHVGYKVAAEMGERYIGALEEFENVIAKNVTENIYARHLKRVFIGD